MLLLDFHPETLSIWLIFMWCFIFPVILNGLPWKQTERDFVFSVEGLSVRVHCGYQYISHAVKTL